MTLDEATEKTQAMWRRLADQIDTQASKAVLDGDFVKAVRLGRYADACYFQATGEGEGKTVNELIAAESTAAIA